MSSLSDTAIVKKAFMRYEQIVGANINFGKSEGCGWVPGGLALPCLGLSAGVTDPSESSMGSPSLAFNSYEVSRKC